MNIVERIDEMHRKAIYYGEGSLSECDFEEELAKHWPEIRAVLLAAESLDNADGKPMDVDYCRRILRTALSNLNKP